MNDTLNNIKSAKERIAKINNKDDKVVANNELATPKSDEKIEVYATSSAVKPKNWRRKKAEKQESQVVTDADLNIKKETGEVVNRKLSGKQAKLLLKNKLIGFKKKLKKVLIVGLIAAAVGAGIYTYNKNNENGEAINSNSPAASENMKSEAFFSEQAVIDNSVDMMIEHYIANNGKSEMSARDALYGVVGFNLEYITADDLNNLGIAGNVDPKVFADGYARTALIIKNDARNYGAITEGKFIKNDNARTKVIEVLEISHENANGNISKIMVISEAFSKSGGRFNTSGETIVSTMVIQDYLKSEHLNKPANCINETQLSTYHSNNMTTVEDTIENKMVQAITLNDGKEANPEALVNIVDKIQKGYEEKKATVKLSGEDKTFTVGGSEIPDDKSVDKAEEAGAKVDHNKKTVNENPKNVKDESQKGTGTTIKSNIKDGVLTTDKGEKYDANTGKATGETLKEQETTAKENTENKANETHKDTVMDTVGDVADKTGSATTKDMTDSELKDAGEKKSEETGHNIVATEGTIIYVEEEEPTKTR